MTVLVIASLLGQVFVVALMLAVRRLPRLSEFRSLDLAPVALLKPVLCDDAATLARCRGWVESAAGYPGEATVIFTTVEGPAAASLRTLADGYAPSLVKVVATATGDRQNESGLDKTNRLAAAAEYAAAITPARAIWICTDEDVAAIDPRAVERLAAACSEGEGRLVSVILPPLHVQGAHRWWHSARQLHFRTLGAILALGDILFRRAQGMVLGAVYAAPRSFFEKIGGFQSLASSLGDEVAVGRSAARARLSTLLTLPDGVLEIVEDGTSMRAFLAQLHRWSVLRRGAHPLLAAAMLFGLPLRVPFSAALLAVAVAPGPSALALVASAWFVSGLSFARAPLEWLLVPIDEWLLAGSHVSGLLPRVVSQGPWSYGIDTRARITQKKWLENASSE